MKRNSNLIACKRGQKFAMDRDAWSTYCNFVDMYKIVYARMEDACMAEKIEGPRWLDENGDESLDQQGEFRCKATHNISFQSYHIFVDEVGYNTDQEDDGHIGGELKIVE